MRGLRAVGILLLALLLAGPAALGQAPQVWDQLGGSAARTGAAFLPGTTLDILDSRDIFYNNTRISLFYSKGLVSTPHGLLALAQEEDGACVLLRIGAVEVTRIVLDACDAATLTAYDRPHDRLLVCSEGGPSDPVFQSRDAATGALVWAVRPASLGAGGSEPLVWDCTGTALGADGSAFVAIMGSAPGATTTTRILRVESATGDIMWDRTFDSASLYAGGTAPLDLIGADAAGKGFIPIGLSLTDSGLVVSGRAYCACGKGDPLVVSTTMVTQGAVAWLDPDDGDVVGAALAEDDTRALAEGIPARRYGQWWATTQGPLAAFALGERVHVVNPTEKEPIRSAPFSGIETGRGFIGIIPSVWWDDTILVPIAKSVTAVDAQDLSASWSWSAGERWVVSALLALPPSDALVLVVDRNDGDEREAPAVLHRLDMATGAELQRLRLPHPIWIDGGTGRARFQPLDDGGLLLYTLDGRLFTLGVADAALLPTLRAPERYPAPSQNVELAVASPDADATYVVAWGDGLVEEGNTSWTHRYGDEGPRTARVTAQFADGRTATSEILFRVGATPPPTLTPLQRAFAPERQDLTFGILGIIVTLLGAAIAIFARRRRHGRLHDELRALERIREQGRSHPEDAIRALGAYRTRLLAEVHAHRIDDAQLNTLESRSQVVFAALRTRLLGPAAGRLSADFRHALDVVLHDGRVDEDEGATLRGALDHERQVSDAERARLVALLDRLAQ